MKSEEEIERWIAKRKSALVMDIIPGKTTVSEASRTYYLTPSEIESWVGDAKRGMEKALRDKPKDMREQHERQLRDLHEAYGEAMLELRCKKKATRLAGRGREMILRVQQGLAGEGVAVSLSQLCRWFKGIRPALPS